MALTKLENLVDPEVMADMIGATLPKRIKFTNIAGVDNTRSQSLNSRISARQKTWLKV